MGLQRKNTIGLQLAFCVGQSYDGAAAMRQRPVRRHFDCTKQISVDTLFSLCYALSASAALKVSTIQNAENVARKVVKMFKTSAKETACLKSCIKEDVSSQGP